MTIAVKSIKLTNFLSFGPDSEAIELRDLNLLIGANGSGKSNLLEAFALLKAAPYDLTLPIREGGGVEAWLWNGTDEVRLPNATVAALLKYPQGRADRGNESLFYSLSFTERNQRLQVVDEVLESSEPSAANDNKKFRYVWQDNDRVLVSTRVPNVPSSVPTSTEPDRNLYTNQPGSRRLIVLATRLNGQQSILSQRKDPDQYPELTFVGQQLDSIRLYRDWNFSRYSSLRRPQPADTASDVLSEDAGNLGLVLNNLRLSRTWPTFLSYLREFYEDAEDADVRVQMSTAQIFLRERGSRSVPATRLSDGTLRWLWLLTMLLNRQLPPVICLEEPELGLHPDMIPVLARLLREAATRTQLIVTTHSDDLISQFSDTSESVLVFEKDEGATKVRQFRNDQLVDLQEWLRDYSLGQLRAKGFLGGNPF